MKKLTYVILATLLIPTIYTFAQKVDSVRIYPTNPGPTDSIEVTVYGVLTSGGVTITRIENNFDLNSNSILINIYGRHCGGGAVITPFEHIHVFPSMNIGSLEVCCSTYMDTNSIPGPNGDCDLSDTLIPLWNVCESYHIVSTIDNRLGHPIIRLNPNPTRGNILSIQTEGYWNGKELLISVYDLAGKLCFQNTVKPIRELNQVHMTNTKSGTYILTIDDGVKQVLVEKIILLQ